jgi:hypothetical protein
MRNRTLRPLAVVFASSGLWDMAAGVMVLFLIGTGRRIDSPPMDPFYAVFLASFFFCFAYIQIMSAADIGRYLFNVGCLILGRVFYVVVLYSFILFGDDFPSTFWFTGIIDMTFVMLYMLFAVRGGLGVRDLFLPARDYRTVPGTSRLGSTGPGKRRRPS